MQRGYNGQLFEDAKSVLGCRASDAFSGPASMDELYYRYGGRLAEKTVLSRWNTRREDSEEYLYLSTANVLSARRRGR